MPKTKQSQSLGSLNDFTQPPASLTPLEELQERVLVLERKLANMESLLVVIMEQLDNPSKSPSKPKVSKAKSSKPNQKSKSLSDKIVAILTDANEPLTRSEIASELAVSRDETGKPFSHLFTNKIVRKTGEKRDGESLWTLRGESASLEPQAPVSEPSEPVEDDIPTLRPFMSETVGIDDKELREKTGLSRNRIKRVLKRMSKLGLAVYDVPEKKYRLISETEASTEDAISDEK